MRRVLPFIMATSFFVVSVGAAPATKAPKSRQGAPSKPYQVGRASWYGKMFHGKATASGEPYDMFQLTAAHRQLPLGTLVKVTNLRNDKWVIVRINDRGPIPPSRIIDLSYGAASMLEFRGKGVEKVRLDVINPDTVAFAQSPEGLQ
jgi:rare lipoprotein A